MSILCYDWYLKNVAKVLDVYPHIIHEMSAYGQCECSCCPCASSENGPTGICFQFLPKQIRTLNSTVFELFHYVQSQPNPFFNLFCSLIYNHPYSTICFPHTLFRLSVELALPWDRTEHLWICDIKLATLHSGTTHFWGKVNQNNPFWSDMFISLISGKYQSHMARWPWNLDATARGEILMSTPVFCVKCLWHRNLK